MNRINRLSLADGTTDGDPEPRVLSQEDKDAPVVCHRCKWAGKLHQLKMVSIHKTLCPACSSEDIEFKEG